MKMVKNVIFYHPLELKLEIQFYLENNAPLKIGNALPLSKIPTGMFVHNVELNPGNGGQMVRSAGAVCSSYGTRLVDSQP